MRPLPGLYHGSLTLLRTQDTTRLIGALLRVLGSHTRPANDGEVRLDLMPVVRDRAVLLAPPASISSVPDRWMTAQGLEAVYTVSSLVDVERAQVLVDPPLGSDDDHVALPFGGWWLPPLWSDSPLSTGFAVAEAMKLVTDVTAANAMSALGAVAKLVERTHPGVAPRAAEALKASLIEALEQATSRSF
jgi:hypothetical protein